MSFTFRPAARSNASLLISLAGGTGSGKSFSAMRLATGLAGGKRFAVIDSENGRAGYYCDMFAFDSGDLRAPFRPDAYMEAIKAADAAGYPVIVIDSFSHSWAGEGGVLDWQEEELDRMAGSDWKKREACKVAAWIKPKVAMKSMIGRMLQIRAHLIFCLRAEQKIEMSRGSDGKMTIQPKQSLAGLDGWIPICSKEFPFEMTASFLLTADAPGVPKPIKLQAQHREFFPAGKPITEAAGVALAAWASGGIATPKPAQPAAAVTDHKHSGICGQVLERMAGKVKVFDAQINGEIFSTTDESLAERARQFAGIPVVATFTPTAKGGRQLTAIYDAEDPHV